MQKLYKNYSVAFAKVTFPIIPTENASPREKTHKPYYIKPHFRESQTQFAKALRKQTMIIDKKLKSTVYSVCEAAQVLD